MILDATAVSGVSIVGRIDPACQGCGTPNPEALRVCGVCGATTPPPRFIEVDVDHVDENPLLTFWRRLAQRRSRSR